MELSKTSNLKHKVELKTKEDEGDIQREREKKCVLGEGNDLFLEDISSCMVLKSQCVYTEDC